MEVVHHPLRGREEQEEEQAPVEVGLEEPGEGQEVHYTEVARYIEVVDTAAVEDVEPVVVLVFAVKRGAVVFVVGAVEVVEGSAEGWEVLSWFYDDQDLDI